ncbi:MAG: 1,4-dihydroxy-2-naphthoate octaprenyltransferase [Candidatus Thorarchaeota archaeon]
MVSSSPSSESEQSLQSPSKARIWLRELRLPFLTASLVPIFLGTAIAWMRFGLFDPWYFFLTLIAGAFLHFGANVSNDYFDYKSGADEMHPHPTPFSGGSRVIQDGLLSPKTVLIGSFVCFGVAVVIGLYLYIQLGIVILILGIIGAASGFFYTAPPLRLVSRGIGEIFIGLNFGVLMTLGAYYVQAVALDWEPVWASIPVALLISAVLYINEFPDFEADKAAEKYTVVVRLGRPRAAKGFALLMAVTYLVMLVVVYLHLVHEYLLLGLITLPLAILAVRVALTHSEEPMRMIPANAGTIMTHLFTGLFMTTGYILAGFGMGLGILILAAALMLLIVIKLLRDLTRPPPGPPPAA